MKRILAILIGLTLIGFQSLAQETDDLYFFKSDRKQPVKTALALPQNSDIPDFSQNQGGEAVVQDKFLNPDFNANNATNTNSNSTYVQENELLAQGGQTWNNINNPNNPSTFNNNTNSSFWGNPSLNMGMGTGSWGSFSSIGIGFGMGNLMGSPWGFNRWGMRPSFGWGNGFYDPFWGNSFNNPWNRWNTWCPPFYNTPTVAIVEQRPRREFNTYRNTTGTRSRGNVVPVRTANMQQRVSQLASRNDRSSYMRNQSNNSRSISNRNFSGRSNSRSNSSFQNRNNRSRNNSSFSTPRTNSFRTQTRSIGNTRSSGTRSRSVSRTTTRRRN